MLKGVLVASVVAWSVACGEPDNELNQEQLSQIFGQMDVLKQMSCMLMAQKHLITVEEKVTPHRAKSDFELYRKKIMANLYKICMENVDDKNIMEMVSSDPNEQSKVYKDLDIEGYFKDENPSLTDDEKAWDTKLQEIEQKLNEFEKSGDFNQPDDSKDL